MKIVFAAINSRHTHSAIALAYLAAYWQKDGSRPVAQICEFDLNQTNETIYSELILACPDVIAFSVYIWSLERTLTIAAALKAACPKTQIILGGPEVSFSDIEILQQNSFVDFVVRGEGEITLTELLTTISNKGSFADVNGLSWRDGACIERNPDRELIKNLDDIPSPFINGFFGNGYGFTYYEASRGCPSNCSYCLSSVQGPVRNHSLARVKADLDWFFASEYCQIRFADRTFNFDFKRATEIISYIIANNYKKINFHFEIQADFLHDEVFALLKSAPEGMFHLEIGVQSTNSQALTQVNRGFNLEQMKMNVTRLKSETGAHLHLDLLGGLPEDSFAQFLHSLDEVWQLQPHSIQISLVKVLRGTPLQKRVASGELNCMERPPYTVLRTNWLTASEAVKLQDIGKLVEGIYNCGRYELALNYIIKYLFADSAGRFFQDLAEFWRRRNWPFYNFGPDQIFNKLSRFLESLPAAKTLVEAARILLEHEFHLSQKVPVGDSKLGPEFVTGKNRSLIKVVPGLKSFWYAYDLEAILCASAKLIRGAFPVVYSYEKDLSTVPDTRLVELNLAERFVIASLQRKIAQKDFSQQWRRCIGEKLLVPEFATVIENLKEKGLLYDSREKNYREVKQLIEQSRHQ